MPRIMRGRTLAVSTITSLVISAPAAFALIDDAPSGEPVDEPTDTTVMWEVDEDAPIPYAFDAEKGILILDLVGAKADDEADEDSASHMCLPTKVADAETEGDAATEGATGDDAAPTEGCLEIDVTGPNGQINHGSVVSNTVHALKEIRDELDGPLGHYIREIAKSDLGKGGEDSDGDDDTETGEVEEAKPAKADKETGRPEHAGDGNGNGNAPAHSNAGGNGKGKNK